MTHFISQNGKLIPSAEAAIPVTNKAMFFNFAVYDSLKVVQGKPFFPEYHVDRLLESAALIKLEHPFTKEQILDWTRELIAKNRLENSLIRTLLQGSADKDEEAMLYMLPLGLTFYPNSLYSQGAKVITYNGERLIPKAKIKDLLLNFLAYREAVNNEALDALLVDKEGYAREGTRTNLFIVKDDVLITPPLEKVLEGITRKILLSVVDGYMAVEERNIGRNELFEADAVFITSTSMNIMPIRQIDQTIISDTVHPHTKTLMSKFKQYYNAHVLHKA